MDCLIFNLHDKLNREGEQMIKVKGTIEIHFHKIQSVDIKLLINIQLNHNMSCTLRSSVMFMKCIYILIVQIAYISV